MCTIMNIGAGARYLLSPESWGNGPGYVCMLEDVNGIHDKIYEVEIVAHSKNAVMAVPREWEPGPAEYDIDPRDVEEDTPEQPVDRDVDPRNFEDYETEVGAEYEEMVDAEEAELNEVLGKQDVAEEYADLAQEREEAEEDDFDWDAV